MAGSRYPSSNPKINLQEMSQDLHFQLTRNQKDFQNLKEKYLIYEAMAYSLANQLKKLKCEESQELIESVLRRPQSEQLQVAKNPTPAEILRKHNVLIQDQDRELRQLHQKLQEGRVMSQILLHLLKKLLTQQDPNNHQGQDYQRRLAEIIRMTERLVRMLDPENKNDPEEMKGDRFAPRKQH